MMLEDVVGQTGPGTVIFVGMEIGVVVVGVGVGVVVGETEGVGAGVDVEGPI